MTIPLIDEIPTPPSRQDSPNFDPRADLFLGALPTLRTQLNAAIVAINAFAPGLFRATSATSLAIGTGTKVFVLDGQADEKMFYIGCPVRIADTASPATNWMRGVVTAYAGSTLTVAVSSVNGSGTLSAWSIGPEGALPVLADIGAAPATVPGRNRIINGNFDIWQRGTSWTTSGLGSGLLADRWKIGFGNSVQTISRQALTPGSLGAPCEPAYFFRSVVASSAGAGNYSILEHRIEDVRTLAGQYCTLTFWAKADASKSIAIELYQAMGTGGSPSADVSAIGSQKIALTTSWQKYTVTVAVPSLAGKTLGTNNDHFLSLFFWLEGGASFGTRSASLGQQSGTFDLAQVQLEAGSVATPFEFRPIGRELALCQRYCEKSFALNQAPVTNLGSATGEEQSVVYVLGGGINSSYSAFIPFKVAKRTSPTIILYNRDAAANNWTWYTTSLAAVNGGAATNISARGFQVALSADTTRVMAQGHWSADAEL